MMVASGRGVYLCLGVPLTSPQPASGVAVLPVSDPGATIEVCVARPKGRILTPDRSVPRLRVGDVPAAAPYLRRWARRV